MFEDKAISSFNGFRIMQNPAIPDGVIFVSPNDFLRLKDPEKWQEIQEKATKEMTDKLEDLLPTTKQGIFDHDSHTRREKRNIEENGYLAGNTRGKKAT